ncbi:resuscitation-promoting factor [Aeromicrobium halocynthiae]|uniref:Resuscitation-promoting factor n=1 Tax=Aeromicrobium halocynthiae TaxID=560557 RepID=A0ABN2VYT2_9ACTN
MHHPRHSAGSAPVDASGRISRKLVIALNLAVLMVLGSGVAAYGAFSKTVTVDVDGETETVRTFGGSVGSILESRDVDVEAADAVSAEPTEPVSDGDTIAVRYDKAITFAVDGEVTRETIPAATVGEALEAAGIEPGADAYVSGSEDELLADAGDAVVVSHPKKVKVVSGDDTTTLTTEAPTAAQVVEEAGITLGEGDRIDGGHHAWVSEGQTIRVKNVEYVHDEDELQTKPKVEYRDDDSLPEGETEVIEEGRPGIVKQTALVTKVDGKETHRLVIVSDTVQKSEARIVRRGTAPAAAAAESAPSVADGSVWDRLAQCESGGNWAANTGNGYYGGVQFSAQTWSSLGAPGLPHEQPREVQIKYAQMLQERAGWGQWPACSAKLGLR